MFLKMEEKGKSESFEEVNRPFQDESEENESEFEGFIAEEIHQADFDSDSKPPPALAVDRDELSSTQQHSNIILPYTVQ